MPQIQKHDIRLLVPEHRDGILQVQRLAHIVTKAFEILDDKACEIGLVIDDSVVFCGPTESSVKATLDRLISMGATEYQPITDHSQGKGTFVTASVADPFGNILGIMTNVHYLAILKQKNS